MPAAAERHSVAPGTLTLAIALIALTIPLLGEDVSSPERLGREIYRYGKGNAPIDAVLGNGQPPIAAAVVPCASCHGADGRGRPEGGVVPANIAPAALGAELEATPQGGRKRIPYTDRTLKRAIAMGIDSSGNPLGAAMPRYQMSSEDMSALMAYLKTIGDAAAAGVTANAVRVGVLLAPKEHLEGVQIAVRKVLQAYFDAKNRAGGIYDRQVELVFAECDGSPAARAAAAAKFIDAEKPLALIASFTDGADDELAAVADERAIPLLATVSSRARSDTSKRYVRDLVAGLHDQTRALAQFIARKFPHAHVAVLHEHDERSKSIADAAVEELRKNGIAAKMLESSVAPKTLKAEGIDAILYAGASESLARLAASTRELSWSPTVFVSSSLIHPDVLDRSRTTARFYIALPIGPDDLTKEAVAAWRKLAGDDTAAKAHQASQFAALASAQVFVAALERAGRDLTRETLLSAIDGITALHTGLTPPLTYSPARHLGSTGAYIVSISGEEQGEGRVVWVDPG